jgi:hypothetical protein
MGSYVAMTSAGRPPRSSALPSSLPSLSAPLYRCPMHKETTDAHALPRRRPCHRRVWPRGRGGLTGAEFGARVDRPMAELLPETGTHHLSDRLRAARRRRFVGRQPEFELFRLTLLDPDLGCGDSPIDALAKARPPSCSATPMSCSPRRTGGCANRSCPSCPRRSGGNVRAAIERARVVQREGGQDPA